MKTRCQHLPKKICGKCLYFEDCYYMSNQILKTNTKEDRYYCSQLPACERFESMHEYSKKRIPVVRGEYEDYKGRKYVILRLSGHRPINVIIKYLRDDRVKSITLKAWRKRYNNFFTGIYYEGIDNDRA